MSSSRGPMTPRARHGESTPTPLNTGTHPDEPIASKRDLKSWWKTFSRGNQKREEDNKVSQGQGIFGIPLQTSVKYANVAISLQDPDGHSYVYGYVPIVVAKCGVFLKEKATDVEGIFRLSGSEKRIKELREAFNSPDRYGKGLDWTGYTVHDAANILRRYFNQLPEPIIPLEFYERFRNPLRNHQSQAVGPIDGQSPSVGDFDHQTTIRVYQQLITELPPLNRQLLLYILDLLAVFASKSDLNKMTTPNLAAIFQPGLLSHPNHDMAPPEYRLSQDVLIFLIENQDHFLIGMPGTGADEDTRKDVESGPPTPSAGRAPKSLLGRSSSGASRFSSGVRRSVSVSSKQSATPVTPSPVSPQPLTPTNIGVSRSNTLPSKHSPRPGGSLRFQRPDRETTPPEASSPEPTPMYTPAEMPGAFPNIGDSPLTAQAPFSTQPPLANIPASPEVTAPSPPEVASPVITPAQPVQPIPQATPIEHISPATYRAPSPRPTNIDIPPQARAATLPPSATLSPSQQTPTSGTSSKGLAALFAPKPATPTGDGGKKPNKLQKKRGPGSANPSAQSSSHSLTDASNAEQTINAFANAPPLPMQTREQQAAYINQLPMAGYFQTQTHSQTLNAPPAGPSSVQQTPTNPTFLQPNRSADNTPLKPPPVIGTQPMSPANSYRSHSEFTEAEIDSDVQPLDNPSLNEMTSDGEANDHPPESAQKKTRFWRKKGDSVSYNMSPNFEAQKSRSSILSGGDKDKDYSRKSLTLDRNTTLSDPENGEIAAGNRGSKGMVWFKGKMAERAERKEEKDRVKEEQKRSKSPPGDGNRFGHFRGVSQSIQSLSATPEASTSGPSLRPDDTGNDGGRTPPHAEVPTRGRSMDFRREGRSTDAPREGGLQPKQRVDAAMHTFAPPNPQFDIAGNPVDPAVGDRSVRRRRSLLETGEDTNVHARSAAVAALRKESSGDTVVPATGAIDEARKAAQRAASGGAADSGKGL